MTDKQREVITLRISKYLTNEIAGKIAKAQWGTSEPTFINQIKITLFDLFQFGGESFEVICENDEEALVGRLHCIRNDVDHGLWYYGDLYVIPEYRRMGIASKMINCAIAHVSEIGGKKLRTYVSPENSASISLQRSLMFEEKPYETFNGLTNDGQIMFERRLESDLTVIPATSDEAYFCAGLYYQNRESLHTEPIALSAWREILSADDPDEEHFLISKGAMPTAYIKLNGLVGNGVAWISMLFVSPAYQRRGIGTFAVGWAEEYLRTRGFCALRIQTTEDNLPARGLYNKSGYTERYDAASGRCFYEKRI